jgi:hypothetical protein
MIKFIVIRVSGASGIVAVANSHFNENARGIELQNDAVVISFTAIGNNGAGLTAVDFESWYGSMKSSMTAWMELYANAAENANCQRVVKSILLRGNNEDIENPVIARVDLPATEAHLLMIVETSQCTPALQEM